GAAPGASSGGLGGLLSGALAGGAAGSILSGGLDSLLKQFQQNGQGQAAQSWVGKGPNQQISENDLARSIGSDDIDALAQHTGMSRNELLAGLSRELPDAIDELTPEGRLPTREEASRWV
ncbi:MAG: YidB family protein, partial [Xanthobacteraceae bacterium]|nr:YidB family protein [Xanthobacteraceae bacterium]